jgi:hypothetical protein
MRRLISGGAESDRFVVDGAESELGILDLIQVSRYMVVALTWPVLTTRRSS